MCVLRFRVCGGKVVCKVAFVQAFLLDGSGSGFPLKPEKGSL